MVQDPFTQNIATLSGNTPLVVGAGGQGTATTSLEGSITVAINGHNFTLSGPLTTPSGAPSIHVEYHADFDKAIRVGSIVDIAATIDQALGNTGHDVKDAITSAQTTVKTLPVVGNDIADIFSAQIVITDLVIIRPSATAASTYELGLALDFGGLATPPQLFGITLISLCFKVTRTTAAKAPSVTP
jgi:hypothetical protein